MNLLIQPRSSSSAHGRWDGHVGPVVWPAVETIVRAGFADATARVARNDAAVRVAHCVAQDEAPGKSRRWQAEQVCCLDADGMRKR